MLDSNRSATTSMPSPADPAPAEFDLMCEQCSYSLVGLIHTNQCPECGCYFDPYQLPLARVPWLFRKKIGILNAYFSTLKLVLTTPSTFAKELCRPVRISPIDARGFRGATGWLAALGILLPALLLAALMLARANSDRAITLAFAMGVFWGTKVFVQVGSDMPTFIWEGPNPDDPHQLSPMQYYSTAPMVLIGIPAAFAMAGWFIQYQFRLPFAYYIVLYTVAALCAAIMFGWLWVSATLFMWAGTGKSIVRAAGLFIILPIFQTIAFGVSAFLGLLVGLITRGILNGIL